MTEERLGSSPAERPEHREVAGSVPARGFPTATWLFVVVRKEMTGGALLAQVAHASSEAASQYVDEHGHEIPADTRACILGVTKEQMATVKFDLEEGCFSHRVVLETDGPLAGVVTAIGIVIDNRELVKPILGQLRPWRAP